MSWGREGVGRRAQWREEEKGIGSVLIALNTCCKHSPWQFDIYL